MNKIGSLIDNTNFRIKWYEKHIVEDLIKDISHGQYYVLLEK